ncbi:MAG TPA: helix-turn-helix transcriptional regulator [Ktedonobacteraceae bacterium]|nr:helix-turn-helix transcriptional regulator [Ktedonobacteraceae bacterium]
MKYKLKVKEVADAKKMTMGRLSRRADLDKATTSRLYNEPSTYNPSLLTLLRVARALKVTLNDLVDVLPDDGQEEE